MGRRLRIWELGIDPVLKPEDILTLNHEESPINENLFLEDVSTVDFNIDVSSVDIDDYLHNGKLDNLHSDDLSSDNDFFTDIYNSIIYKQKMLKL
jgi:hypothetical protein